MDLFKEVCCLLWPGLGKFYFQGICCSSLLLNIFKNSLTAPKELLCLFLKHDESTDSEGEGKLTPERKRGVKQT
jgi:hypothetical protein